MLSSASLNRSCSRREFLSGNKSTFQPSHPSPPRSRSRSNQDNNTNMPSSSSSPPPCYASSVPLSACSCPHCAHEDAMMGRNYNAAPSSSFPPHHAHQHHGGVAGMGLAPSSLVSREVTGERRAERKNEQERMKQEGREVRLMTGPSSSSFLSPHHDYYHYGGVALVDLAPSSLAIDA